MLITASQIIEKSWKFYLTNWRKLFPYMAAFGLLMFLSSAFQVYNAYEAHYGFLINSGLVLFIAFFAFIIILSLLSIWISIALTRAIADLLQNQPARNWKNVFQSIKPVIWPTIYTSLFAGIIIFGGTLLFIIPGIIFTIWYGFSTYAVVLDGKKGGEALRLSKSLVVGRWWRMVWRILVPGLLFGLIGYAIALAILLPFNWSSFSSSLNLSVTLPPDSSSQDFQSILSSAAGPLPSIGLTLINSFVTSIMYMLLIPLSTSALIMLYMSAKENPVSPTTPSPTSPPSSF